MVGKTLIRALALVAVFAFAAVGSAEASAALESTRTLCPGDEDKPSGPSTLCPGDQDKPSGPSTFCPGEGDQPSGPNT